MMKRTIITRVLSVLLLATMLIGLVACQDKKKEENNTPVHVDYAGELKLDMSSNTLKQEVDVHIYIDGDTTHFNVPKSLLEEGVIKARYLAINTPESTGRIEPWGKKASDFTKERLKNATSIIIESDDDKLNADSTGNRYMLWIWYKTDEMSDYRNLNVEILQNGLAIASNSAQNRYGETCMKAIEQAKAEKLHVYSTDKDPEFHYGAAEEMTLKQLLAVSPFMTAAFVGRAANPADMLAIHYVTLGIANPVAYAALRMQAVAIQFPPEWTGDRRLLRFAVVSGLLLGIVPLLFSLPSIGGWYYGKCQNMPPRILDTTRFVSFLYSFICMIHTVRGRMEGLAALNKCPSAVMAGQFAYFFALVAVLAVALPLGVPGWAMSVSAIYTAPVAATVATYVWLKFRSGG